MDYPTVLNTDTNSRTLDEMTYNTEVLQSAIQYALDVLSLHPIITSCNVCVTFYDGIERVYCVMRNGQARLIAGACYED
jgi:hypothetical protein